MLWHHHLACLALHLLNILQVASGSHHSGGDSAFPSLTLESGQVVAAIITFIGLAPWGWPEPSAAAAKFCQEALQCSHGERVAIDSTWHWQNDLVWISEANSNISLNLRGMKELYCCLPNCARLTWNPKRKSEKHLRKRKCSTQMGSVLEWTLTGSTTL